MRARLAQASVLEPLAEQGNRRPARRRTAELAGEAFSYSRAPKRYGPGKAGLRIDPEAELRIAPASLQKSQLCCRIPAPPCLQSE